MFLFAFALAKSLGHQWWIAAKETLENIVGTNMNDLY